MSQFPWVNPPNEFFSPFDENPFSQIPDGAQPFDPSWHEAGEESDCPSLEQISQSSFEDPPLVQTATNTEDVLFTNTEDLRSVLATLSHYNTGHLGNHLKDFRGLLILPLDAVTILRTGASGHYKEYPVIVFYPHKEFQEYQTTLPNFIESLSHLYSAS